MTSLITPLSSSYANAYATTGSGATGSSSSSATSPTTAATSDPLANESTFLQLLVSQLKNQNPMSPMDGTTFVTQLAQFSDLEQNLAMRTDLDSINSKYTGAAAASSTSATGGSDSSSSSQSISN